MRDIRAAWRQPKISAPREEMQIRDGDVVRSVAVESESTAPWWVTVSTSGGTRHFYLMGRSEQRQRASLALRSRASER
ncbi:hypothetical protein PN498_26450 [Oscillatoria sp. CS-180]|nr:hypothetical protein [Oscillatoria sp. CS-180]